MFKIGSVFIPVTNLKKATTWYEKNLGVKIIDYWEDGAGFYFPSSTTQLALVQVESRQSTEFTTKGANKSVYFNFIVHDIREAYQYLNNNGVKTTPLMDFDGMEGFDFFDLDGNTFSVVNEKEDSTFHSNNIKKLQMNDRHL